MRRAVLLGVRARARRWRRPRWAENQVVIGRDTLDWDKPDVVVAPGETVTWTFPGTTQVHNVAGNGADASDPNWDTFASPFGVPGAGRHVHVPDAEGTYNFVCEVHPGTMLGTVTVSAVPVATPTPTPCR